MKVLLNICALLQLCSALTSHVNGRNNYETELQPDRCGIDRHLQKIAGKQFAIEDILTFSATPRQCLKPQTSSAHENRSARLIYVTPWNRDGYSYTSLHSPRISHVAPVWYQVKLRGASVTLEGADAVNQTWLSSLDSTTKVVPRFEVLFTTKKEVEAVLFFPRNEVADIIRTILKEVTLRGYHGITLEISYVAQMSHLVTQLGQALHKAGKELVLVIPAHHKLHEVSPFSRRDMLKVANHVDFFSLNAYDHGAAQGQSIGNAPLPWLGQMLDELLGSRTNREDGSESMTANEDDEDDKDPFDDDDDIDDTTESFTTTDKQPSSLAHKLLMGLNFYGYTFTSDGVINTITATEYRGLLEFSQVSIPLTVEWDEKQAEHGLDGKLWTIWYPTVLSLLHRIHLAREYGVGLAVWEGGQGMDHFWDVIL